MKETRNGVLDGLLPPENATFMFRQSQGERKLHFLTAPKSGSWGQKWSFFVIFQKVSKTLEMMVLHHKTSYFGQK